MITVHNLHNTYGPQTVLAGVNASFAAGRLTSLIGPNGAGKTTLLQLLTRSPVRTSSPPETAVDFQPGVRPIASRGQHRRA